jgi:YD repeat-containing protein
MHGKPRLSWPCDVWDRPHRITLPAGAVRTLHWGANDKLLDELVEEGAGGALLSHRKYEYDQRGRLIVATVFSFRDLSAGAVPVTTRYLYDKDDRVRELRLPRGAAFAFEFDGSGRRLRETDPHGNVREFGYAAAGDLTTVTMIDAAGGVPRSRSASLTYDARGRLTQTTFLDAITRFDYDDRDLIVGQRLPDGVTGTLQLNAHAEVVESIPILADCPCARNSNTTGWESWPATWIQWVGRLSGSGMCWAAQPQSSLRTEPLGSTSRTSIRETANW